VTIPDSLHFVGIGGIGMSAVAEVWCARGGSVSGSDLHDSPILERLRAAGIHVALGHAPEHLEQAQALVVSTAVKPDNPELLEASRRGLPVFHRSQVLGALMREKCSVAVTGTHGKTTTTGMLASVMLAAKLDPTVLLGGELPLMSGNARVGASQFLVAEADESDKSIVNLSAQWVIITNVEGDHLEHYRDIEEIYEVLARFINGLTSDAAVVVCLDDAGVQRLIPMLERRVVTYGFDAGADWLVQDVVMEAGHSRFSVNAVPLELNVPGRHNVLNAVAAFVVSQSLQIPVDAIRAGLLAFGGVNRRFQTMGCADGVSVIDDYAHHPSEIRATLQAAALYQKRVHVVFQPHRHSRLEALLTDFSQSFDGAASVTILDTYAAGEAPRSVNAGTLADLVKQALPGARTCHVSSQQQAVPHVLSLAQAGDFILLLGAGDIHLMAEPLLQALGLRGTAQVQTA